MDECKSYLSSCDNSFVNVTNEREAHPKFWIAALVQMNCERKSAEKLSKLGSQIMCQYKKKYINGVIDERK